MTSGLTVIAPRVTSSGQRELITGCVAKSAWSGARQIAATLMLPSEAGDPSGSEAAEPEGQSPAEHPFAAFVDGQAVVEARENMVAAAEAVICRGRVLALSDAMSKPELPPPTTSTRRPARRSGVLYCEEWIASPSNCARVVRPARIPIVPVGDDDAAVVAAVAGLGTEMRASRHRSTARRLLPLGEGSNRLAIHAGVELDVWPEVEVLGVAAEILADEALAGVIGKILGHREVGVLGEPLRGDQPRGAVDAAAGVRDVPTAADVAFALEAVEGDAAVAEVFGDGQA